MIEILLQAERALSDGRVDQADRLYRQAVAADPRNSIAVVGLARVALERGDEPEAWRQATRALGIDPENVAAQRLVGRLEEVWAGRGESIHDAATAAAPPVTTPEDQAAGPSPGPDAASTPGEDGARTPGEDGAPTPETDPDPPRERSALDRLLRRNRP